MAKQKKSRFNHARRIEGLQPAIMKAVYPGMFIQFKYDSPNISDPKPIVIVLHRDWDLGLIHGINLNYMSEFQIKQMMIRLQKGAGVYSPKGNNMVRVEDQDGPNDYDDKLPYRNLLTEEYSRVTLPVFKMQREGNPLSLAESKRQMKMLYEKVIRKLINRWDIYRTYSIKKIKTPRVLKLNLEGLLE